MKFLGVGLAAVLVLGLPARADQVYLVTGNDRYQVGQTDLQTSISYTGTQRLIITQTGGKKHFTAKVTYTRADAAGTVPAHASFEQVMTSGGELRDKEDLDPDYLTVLNQPFAIEVDAPTLHDLLRLHGKLPFVFPAPMTGGTLRGFLERGDIARLNGHPVLAVAFDATGPMMGPLPDRAQMSIIGSMRMNGTAYYAVRGEPLLMALDETLTISGTLHDGSHASPVRIVYERSIRAGSADSDTETASSH